MSKNLADKTIDRVICKLPSIEPTWKGNQIDYFIGVAKMIYLESLREVPKELPPPVISDFTEEDFQNLDRALSTLSSLDRYTILEYYRGEKAEKIERRQTLAKELGVPMNALRIKVYRIRVIIQDLMFSQDR